MTLATAFAASANAPADVLRLALLAGAALTAGLIVRELVIRWHDRSVLVILLAASLFGAPFIFAEGVALGQAPSPRLVLSLAGLGLVAAGLIRARMLRRRLHAVAVGIPQAKRRMRPASRLVLAAGVASAVAALYLLGTLDGRPAHLPADPIAIPTPGPSPVIVQPTVQPTVPPAVPPAVLPEPPGDKPETQSTRPIVVQPVTTTPPQPTTPQTQPDGPGLVQTVVAGIVRLLT